MIRRPPRSTRTYTLFPYTTLFRFRAHGLPATRRRVFLDNNPEPAAINAQFDELLRQAQRHGAALAIGHPHRSTLAVLRARIPALAAQGIVLLAPSQLIARYEPRPHTSAERRVGQAGVSTCRSRWSTYHYQK